MKTGYPLEEDIEAVASYYVLPGLKHAIDHVLEAARKFNDPLDELWWCEAHGRPIDVFEKITPKECLYVGRPGPCEPAAALVVLDE